MQDKMIAIMGILLLNELPSTAFSISKLNSRSNLDAGKCNKVVRF